MVLALSNGEVLLIIVFAAIPVAAAAFVGVGTLYRQIGRGQPMIVGPQGKIHLLVR